MTNQIKNIKVEDIKILESIYPRMKIDFVTSARYYNALRSGAVFPPITLAILDSEYVLIDGAHRLKSHKDAKRKTISAEILMDLKTEQEMFIEAIKRNIGHGRQFSTQEVVKISITLKEWNMTDEAISDIIRIPATEITPFVMKRMARITDTDTDVALKSPLKHLAGTPMATEINQNRLVGTSQIVVLDTLIALLKNDWIDRTSELVMEKLTEVHNLTTPYLASNPTQ